VTRLLVTGGAGYIGSHAVVAFLEAGYEIVVVDNLCNSNRDTLDRVAEIVGRPFPFIEADIRDRSALDRVFCKHAIDAVVHFAGLKAVGESVSAPLAYYDNNVTGTIVLLMAMEAAGLSSIVFSSSATVYGDPSTVPIREDAPVGETTNPYGRTRFVIEQILRDVASANPNWRIALLRYFNPVGAHESGLIGEDPRGIPNNLMPYVSQVSIGTREFLTIFGDDYETPDGTGVRDYIHVVDLAHGHLKAVEKLANASGVHVWNLGTGRGHSVREVVATFEKVSGRAIPCKVGPRRPGDIAACWAGLSVVSYGQGLREGEDRPPA
jgi:UDP-glucose 4-epimerase